MISIRKLRKAHAGRATLDGTDAEIRAGETVAIVGPSGGGKTTLLRCLNALEPFDAGSIHVAGFDLGPRPGTLSTRELLRLRTAVGFVFQELHLFAHLTVVDNVTLAPRVVKGEEPEKATTRAMALLERVGMGGRAGAYPHELSGGQKQRVAIARALANEPAVLLLDEPTSALDVTTANGVADMIKELTHGRVTVVLVTHQLELAARMADRVLRLEAGLLHEERARATDPA
jgi:ABC-type polar amino acid transport system ATPase subunit